MSLDLEQPILSTLSAWGITLTDKQIEQFTAYYELMVEWNRHLNLTRITEESAVWRLHYLDSLSPMSCISFSDKSLIDIGTGAGFPGIPLKIANPSLKLTLLDALDKRCRFLFEVTEALGLDEVTILHGRAEDYASVKDQGSLRGCFDLATSRAVAKLSVLCEYAVPFLSDQGQFIAYKLEDSDEELSTVTQQGGALEKLCASLNRQERYTLPDVASARALIFITRQGPTPDKYPRRAGIPEKRPL